MTLLHFIFPIIAQISFDSTHIDLVFPYEIIFHYHAKASVPLSLVHPIPNNQSSKHQSISAPLQPQVSSHPLHWFDTIHISAYTLTTIYLYTSVLHKIFLCIQYQSLVMTMHNMCPFPSTTYVHIISYMNTTIFHFFLLTMTTIPQPLPRWQPLSPHMILFFIQS